MMSLQRCAWIGLAIASAAAAARADELTLVSGRDNTLFEDPQGLLSNGVGPEVYAGRNTIGLLRRGLFRFDVSGIPAGSTVTAVTVTLYMSQTSAPATPMTLHRVTADWGEGESIGPGQGGAAAPGDATWTARFFGDPDALWSQPGGDFVASPSETLLVDGVGFYTFGTKPELVADVQSWVNDSASNLGWSLLGDETPGIGRTLKHFESRESGEPADRPRVTITFTPPVPTCRADWNHSGSVEPADVAAFVGDWVASLSSESMIGDFNGNGTVEPADVAAFVSAWFSALVDGC